MAFMVSVRPLWDRWVDSHHSPRQNTQPSAKAAAAARITVLLMSGPPILSPGCRAAPPSSAPPACRSAPPGCCGRPPSAPAAQCGRWSACWTPGCLQRSPPASRSATSPPQPASSDPSPLPLLSLKGPQRSPLQSSARPGAPYYSQPRRQNCMFPSIQFHKKQQKGRTVCAPSKRSLPSCLGSFPLWESGSAHAVSPKSLSLGGRRHGGCRDDEVAPFRPPHAGGL